MAPLAQAVKWPVISWVVVDVIFIVMLYVEGVQELMTMPVAAPLTIAFGIWAGYKMIELGGSYAGAIVAGVIVGAVCAILTILGIGIIHGAGVGATLPMAVASLGLNISGAAIGGGFALTRPTPAV